MEGTLRKTGALALVALVAIAVVSFGLVQPAHAETKHYFFSFSKSDGVHKCGPAKKQTKNNYVKVQVKKGSDNVFKPMKSVLGLRARTESGAKATQYNVFYNYTDNGKLTYLKDKAIIDHSYTLRGQVDKKSETNLIQIWGYWTP
ncbi:MAG: hypothetical protein UCH28_08540 [Adlercreutzia sp.]|nr:hypothetical protein [Adlercreutzia sp.]